MENLAESFIKKLKFYKSVAKLIKCNETEVSFLQSSTIAWNLFFKLHKISKNNNIIILDNEYGSNFIYFKKNSINIKYQN